MSDKDKPQYVLVDLTDVPPVGTGSTLLRFRQEDNVLVDRVSKALGMTKGAFLRTVVVNATTKAAKELGL